MEEQLNNLDPSKYADDVVTLGIEYLPKLLLALVVLMIGLWVIKKIKKAVAKRIEKASGDAALGKFLTGVLVVILQVVLAISVISMVGVETTSFIAILGSAGLAIGLALQGSLANFAGGVLIMLLRPFKVDDLVEIGGMVGNVTEIGIFATSLVNLDKKTIIIPNGSVMNGTIINYSKEGMLRCLIPVGISYGASMKQAKEVLLEAAKADPRILKDPAPGVVVSSLGESSVDLTVVVFTEVKDYWGVLFDLTQKSKEVLDANGIEIPFPQRVLHQAKA